MQRISLPRHHHRPKSSHRTSNLSGPLFRGNRFNLFNSYNSFNALALPLLFFALFLLASFTAAAADYDILIRNGLVYDGSGDKPFKGDVGIRGQRIAALGKLPQAHGKMELDAKGMAVAPGFINM